MAEVLLSVVYDAAEFKGSELPREPIAGPYGRMVNAAPLELQPTLHEAAGAHLPHGYMEKNKMGINYYSCITCGDNQIYTHNRVTGLTTVYDAQGKFLAAMQYKNKVFKPHSRPYRTWHKMIVGNTCLYATNGTLIYRMEKCPLIAQLPPHFSALLDAHQEANRLLPSNELDTTGSADTPCVTDDTPDTVDWPALLKTRILKHHEVSPAKSMYAEDTNSGITDITCTMDDLFITVGWQQYIYRYTPSGCLRYNLGKFSKMSAIGNRLYVVRGNKIDIYNIDELDTPCVPYATFTIHTHQVSHLVAYGRFIIVISDQHTHTYTVDGIYCDTAYFPEPIVDFCPALGGFLVSHKSHIALYK